MKKIIQVLIALNFSVAFAQTQIKLIVNKNSYKIDKVDIFDLSQKQIFTSDFKDTLTFNFDKNNIDCYNIRYHQGEKMYRQQVWLDRGKIVFKANIVKDELEIDTIFNSPFYYEVKKHFEKLFRFDYKKDSTQINDYLLQMVEKNIENPFSLAVARNYIASNLNSKENLSKLSKFKNQFKAFDWFLIYPSVAENLDKLLNTKSINFEKFSFVDRNNKQTNLSPPKSKFTVLDFWFLKCGPCIQQHKSIKIYSEKLTKSNVEMIGISTDNDLIEWNKYLNKHEYNWSNYLEGDIKNRLSKFLGISGYPTYIVLDNTNTIVGRYNSINDVLQKVGIDK